MANVISGWLAVLQGKGYVAPPNPGNTANAPGDPPVQTGSNGFIQAFAFQGQGHKITDTPFVSPAWQDWGQYALNVGDPSGITGGGYTQSPDVLTPQETDLYFDTTTGLYYNLGD